MCSCMHLAQSASHCLCFIIIVKHDATPNFGSLFPKATLGCFWVQQHRLFLCVAGDVVLALQASMQSSQAC